MEGAMEAQNRLMPLRQAFSLGTFPVVVKEALNLMGMNVGPTRGPVAAMPSEDRKRLASVLKDIGAIQ
jgi:4-hydroxy-tetrahydrodipicolinate synthase